MPDTLLRALRIIISLILTTTQAKECVNWEYINVSNKQKQKIYTLNKIEAYFSLTAQAGMGVPDRWWLSPI